MLKKLSLSEARRILKNRTAKAGPIVSADKASAVKPVLRVASGKGQTGSAGQANGVVPTARERIARKNGHTSNANEASQAVPSHAHQAGGVGQRTAADKAILVVPTPPYGAEGVGHETFAHEVIKQKPTPPRHSDDPRIQKIMGLMRDRRDWIGQRVPATNKLTASIRRKLQPDRAQDETWTDESKTMAKEIATGAIAHARRVRENAERKQIGQKLLNEIAEPEHEAGRTNFVRAVSMSIAEWEIKEDDVLARMVEIAGTLPKEIVALTQSIKGFSLAGLAVIIGHAGHPLDYPTKGHLWKRLGLAPYRKGGTTRAGSTWSRLGGLSKDDWIALGYSRSRLGDLYGKITQPLIKQQWQTPDAGKKIPKDEKRPAQACGIYGEAYGRYKARLVELNESGAYREEVENQLAAAKKAGRKPQPALLKGKLSDSQINFRALRYMVKKLIADLWSAWRRLDQPSCGDKPSAAMSTAAPIEQSATARVSTATTAALPTARQRKAKQVVSRDQRNSADL